MADEPQRRRLPRWKKLLFTILVLVPAVFVLELVLGLCGYCPAVPEPAIVAKGVRGRPPHAFRYFAVSDRRLGFRNRPLGKFRSPYIVGNPLSTTDRYGYRNGVGWSAEGSRPIVLFVGDSITFCSEVDDDETGPSEVAKRLGKEFSVRVLNAGVRGYNTLQAKRMLEECLERFDGIQVAVYTYCGNDLEGNMVANLYFPALAPVVVRDEGGDGFREVEVTEPAVAWGESFINFEFPSVVRERMNREPGFGTPVEKWLDTHSAMWHHSRLALGRAFPERVGEPVLPGGSVKVSPSEYAHWHQWAREHGGSEFLRWILGEMLQLCRDHGVEFLATAYHTTAHQEAAIEFAADCAAQGIPFVSLAEFFPGDPSLYTCRQVDGRQDAHFGTLGTQRYAAGLVPTLTRILPARGIR